MPQVISRLTCTSYYAYFYHFFSGIINVLLTSYFLLFSIFTLAFKEVTSYE